MRTSLKLLIFGVLFLLTYIVYFVEGSYMMLPVTTLVIIGMCVYEFQLVRVAVKNGNAIRVGKEYKFLWRILLYLLLGIVFFVTGLTKQISTFSFWGVGSYSYLGLIVITSALISTSPPVILFKEKGQKRTYYCVELQFSIFRKIEKVIIGNKELVVESKNGQLHYPYVDESQRVAIQTFLSSGFEGKLVINEDAVK